MFQTHENRTKHNKNFKTPEIVLKKLKRAFRNYKKLIKLKISVDRLSCRMDEISKIQQRDL